MGKMLHFALSSITSGTTSLENRKHGSHCFVAATQAFRAAEPSEKRTLSPYSR